MAIEVTDLPTLSGGSLEWVQLDKMFVDVRYQGPENAQRINDIIKNFDEDLLGYLVVSERDDGRFAIVDGRHRHGGLFRLGRKSAMCLVFRGLTIEREARLFYELNTKRRGIPAIQTRFRSLLTAGDPQALGIERIVRSCGFEIDFSGANRSTKRFSKLGAIAVLQSLYSWSPTTLERTLLVVKDAWSGSSDFAGYAELLEGIGVFLRLYPEVDDSELVRKLQETTPLRIVVDARARTTVDKNSIWRQVVEVLFETFNKGKRANRLSRRETPVSPQRQWRRQQ